MEKNWAAATLRSTKRGPRASAPPAAIAADALAVDAAVADSRTRITASPPASRENRAGRLTTPEETHEHHIPKAPEGIEEAGKATGEGGTTRAEKSRQTRCKRGSNCTDNSAVRQ